MEVHQGKARRRIRGGGEVGMGGTRALRVLDVRAGR